MICSRSKRGFAR